jgi:hypothetical protein
MKGSRGQEFIGLLALLGFIEFIFLLRKALSVRSKAEGAR